MQINKYADKQRGKRQMANGKRQFHVKTQKGKEVNNEM